VVTEVSSLMVVSLVVAGGTIARRSRKDYIECKKNLHSV